jgi:sortase B
MIVWLLLLLSICVTVFSGYQLWEILLTYEEGDRNYRQLQEQVRVQDKEKHKEEEGEEDKESAGGGAVVAPSENTVNSIESEARPLVKVPPLSIDFELLKKVNADSAAWLYCPDTVIDYPVMRADDYEWYLRRLPDGSSNANGSLFLDYNCSPDFSGRLNIIYGHNMKSGKMFGSLTEYKKQDYFDRHPYMYLYTEHENYRVDLLYGCVIRAGDWRERAFMYEVNLEALLTCASSTTTFKSAAAYTDTDRFVVLSTCSYEFDDARYIIVGVLRPEYEV